MFKKISETIYYMPNEHERPTLGIVCGEKYSLVIDAGNSPKHGKEFLAEIKQLNLPPIKYVVITHAHWDHFLGMNEFKAAIIVNKETNLLLEKWQELDFDEAALQANSDLINKQCMEIIQNEVSNRAKFKLSAPDIIFEKTLTIDLGNKICKLEQVHSTHSNDATVIYIPDEKVVFLGDCVNGTTEKEIFHYKKELVLPMYQDIQKYEANYYILGHESINTSAEMAAFWQELMLASDAVETSDFNDSILNFIDKNKREPVGDELFYLKAFINNEWLLSQSDVSAIQKF